MTATPQFNTTIQFRVQGQAGLTKWAQAAIATAMDNISSPPEVLRYTCRIATDARDNFRHIDLPDGESLTLHANVSPQFGKNADGLPFLTVTLVYSGDGQAYRVKWVGNAVPKKMLEVAVKHDAGKAVRPSVVLLDLGKATVSPAWRANGRAAPYSQGGGGRNVAKENAQQRAARAAGLRKSAPKRSRVCGRVTAADIPA